MSREVFVPTGGSKKPVMAGAQRVSVRIGEQPVSFTGVPAADIVFVIDTTGSMENEIHGLLRTSEKFVDQLAKKRIKWQIAIVSFGDLTVPGDKILATSFSSDAETVKKSLREIPRNGGGANDGESCLEAIQKATSLHGFRPNAIKTFIVMTDEPALQSRQFTADILTETLRNEGILTFVISEPFNYFKVMASRTGGVWFQISNDTDFMSILDTFSRKVAEVISEVQSLAGGSVRRYMQLKSGKP